MTLLVLGLVVWIAAHAFKRAAPGAHGAMAEAIGTGPARGIVAALILAGLVLMVVGFRRAPVIPLYTPFPWAIHLNNLLMVVAVLLLGAGHSKGRARTWLRHPMLTAVVLWAAAHLLVNGDVAALILFGGLGLWALGSMALINASGPWQRPEPGPLSGDIRLVLIAIVVFAVITTVHTWLGYWPFPR